LARAALPATLLPRPRLKTAAAEVMAKNKKKKDLGLHDLVELMARLRAPDGCPWDHAQTPETLTPYIIEEAHELVDAIHEQDPAHVCEELGDLLFQIVFQAQIGAERGQFDIADVIARIHEKMTRRHPHVFADTEVNDAEEVKKNWARIKEEEGRKKEESVLGRVPRSLPALLRGRRLTENAAIVGFDWHAVEDVLKKLDEEYAELRASIAQGSAAEVEDEYGDLLFVMVNLSRFLKLDPERTLNATIEKFSRRLHYIEQKAAEQGKKLEAMTLAEMDRLWDEAKEVEKV
jgi:tetrapyrrole methylase family protein/MazG family protein